MKCEKKFVLLSTKFVLKIAAHFHQPHRWLLFFWLLCKFVNWNPQERLYFAYGFFNRLSFILIIASRYWLLLHRKSCLQKISKERHQTAFESISFLLGGLNRRYTKESTEGGPYRSEFWVQISITKPYWLGGLRSQIFLKSVQPFRRYGHFWILALKWGQNWAKLKV